MLAKEMQIVPRRKRRRRSAWFDEISDKIDKTRIPEEKRPRQREAGDIIIFIHCVMGWAIAIFLLLVVFPYFSCLRSCQFALVVLLIRSVANRYGDTSKITRANPCEYGIFLPHQHQPERLETISLACQKSCMSGTCQVQV